jgi:glycosyltransferase involved in cell wall biosynthesis
LLNNEPYYEVPLYQGKRLAVVVPAYNEEALISETLRNMPDGADCIYVIDDASTDATRDIVRTLEDERITLLCNHRNLGVGGAIINGYKYALDEDLDIMVVMAGDNQMDAQYLPALLSPVVSGEADYAKGNRLSRPAYRKGMSAWRFFGNWMLTMLTRIASGYWRIGDPQNGYTAVTRDALEKIDLDRVYQRYGYCNDLLVKLNIAGCRVVDVAIPARYGREKSKINYTGYICRVSLLLLRCFLYRIWVK